MVAAKVDDELFAVPALDGYGDLSAVVTDWAAVAPRLREWDPADARPIGLCTLLAPLRSPGKLVCAAANYLSHLQELGFPNLPDGWEPYFFLLPPTSVIGPGDPIVIPDEPDAQVDWEAELAVVIGSPARNVPVERALEHVAAYTIVNDVSARGRLARTNPLAPPFAYDWLGSKGRDTFSPLGPSLTPSWFVDDPQELTVRLWLNDELRQDGTTADMIFTVAQLISSLSQEMTLQPGDVLATGTPAGVGLASGSFLADGDRIRIEIGALEALENTVLTESRADLMSTGA
ncbi:fumarylacetoacetate hydrolase family protein [Nocardia sp. NPDC057272]|uniref:fumarylacetoacetate hydrolase family protein n=1 Tax=Nocardia sp. NPDC057272 TaxID=3346079 RepID=UPI00363E4019